jgi:hypothetical protein
VGTVGDGRYLCAIDNDPANGTVAGGAPALTWDDLIDRIPPNPGADAVVLAQHSNGTPLDGQVFNYDSQFTVSWLGSPGVTRLRIAADGILSVEVPDPDLGATQHDLPRQAPPPRVTGAIVPLWLNMVSCPAGAGPGNFDSRIMVREAANPRRTIVQWDSFGYRGPAGERVCDAPPRLTFQVIWNHATETADLFFHFPINIPQGRLASGITIGGVDSTNVFGNAWQYIPMVNGVNSAALSLPADRIVRLRRCDGPVARIDSPANPSVDQGGQLQIQASATAFEDFGIDPNSWSWSVSGGGSILSGANTASPVISAAGVPSDLANILLRGTVRDRHGRPGTTQIAVAVDNVPPRVDAVDVLGAPTEKTAASFTVQASDPGGAGEIVGYLWKFTAGATSNLANPSYLWSDSGTRSVEVQVKDKGGAWSVTKTIPVTVANEPPEVKSLTPSATEVEPNTPVTLQVVADEPSPADRAAGLTYRFDFGANGEPGNEVTSGSPSASFTYTKPGAYQPRVTVTDQDGGAGEARGETIKVRRANNRPPRAPVPTSPTNSSTTLDPQPELAADTEADPDGDALVYRFEIAKRGSDVPLLTQDVAPADASRIAWKPSQALPKGRAYRWRVGAIDGGNDIPFSEWHSFKVLFAEPPARVSLSVSPGTARAGALVTIRAALTSSALEDLEETRLSFVGTDGLDLLLGTAQLDGTSVPGDRGAVSVGTLPARGEGPNVVRLVTVQARVTEAAGGLGLATAHAVLVDPDGVPLSPDALTDLTATPENRSPGCGGCGGPISPLGQLFAWAALLAYHRLQPYRERRCRRPRSPPST